MTQPTPDFGSKRHLIGNTTEVYACIIARYHFTTFDGPHPRSHPAKPVDKLLDDGIDIDEAITGSPHEVNRITFHAAKVAFAVCFDNERLEMSRKVEQPVLRTCFRRPTVYTLARLASRKRTLDIAFDRGNYSHMEEREGIQQIIAWMRIEQLDRCVLPRGSGPLMFHKVYAIGEEDIIR